MCTLPENGTQPHGGDAQRLQIVELARHSRQRATLKTITSGIRPSDPLPGLPIGLIRAGAGQVTSVEQWTRTLSSITEPIDQQEVDDLVLPGIRPESCHLP